MPRLLALTAFAVALGCAAKPEQPPATPPVAIDAPEPVRLDEVRVPVAPMPHPARAKPGREVPLTTRVAPNEDPLANLSRDFPNTDPGLDPKIEAALPAVERRDNKTVDAAVTNDNTGAPVEAVRQPGKGKEKDTPKTGAASPFSGRTGEAKEKLLKADGGTAETERSVALGLAWLAKQQQADGGWKFDQGKTNERAAATGLVVLSYLGAGFSHKAPAEKDTKSYAKVVKTGLGFLTKQCALNGANTGRLSTDVYANAIGALALVEAYGMTGDAALKPYAQAAVNYIQKSQSKNGSWGYQPQTNGDTSITGWQLQVLYAAKTSKGLVVDNKAVKAALGFLDTTAAGAKKATYGYTDNNVAAPGTSLTAIGLLCRYRHDGWDQKNAGLVEGVAGLLKAAPAKDRLNTYHLYYAALVIRGFGGEDWQTWNEGKKGDDGTRKGGMRDVLPAAQVREGADSGSWKPDSAFVGQNCGRLGTTALCVLSLEVYYRYLPLDERAGDK